MDNIFIGNSTDEIERFFANMIAFDVACPHTETRISPITFSDFLIRNNIMCLNQYDVYNAVNKFWKRYLSLTPNLLDIQTPERLSICEKEHTGWNKLIDFLNRVLDVQKFNDNVYYQMHYLSHVGYLFHEESFSTPTETICYKTIFNDILSPILYSPLIKTRCKFWLPIMNYVDIRFKENVVSICARASSFIENHSGRMMNTILFDVTRLTSLNNFVKETLQNIHEHKYASNAEDWQKYLTDCLTKTALLKADLNLCELKDSFERDGMKCCRILNKFDTIQTRLSKGFLSDPDDAIDELLDVYTMLKKSLESYNLPKETEHEPNGSRTH